MMHPTEPATLLAFCHQTDGSVTRSILRVDGVIEYWNTFEVFRVIAEPSRVEDLRLVSLDGEEYLDRFMLLLPRNDPDRHVAVVEGFFSYISDRYESLIDCARNIGNIRVLTSHLRQVLPSRGDSIKVIDFGCGTGLSMVVDPSLTIIGVDRCPEMRAHASARGMKTLSMEEFTDFPLHSFDGAFASYVLHLGLPAGDLEVLWGRLKPGGALSANFHKNRGIEAVVPVFSRLGADVRVGNPNALSPVHGSYVTFYKPGFESVRHST